MKLSRISRLCIGVSAALAMSTAVAQPQDVKATLTALTQSDELKTLMAAVEKHHARTIKDLRSITEVEAPPFKEKTRAEYVLKRFKAVGLTDAALDSAGNVVGVRKGNGKGPTLLVSAHLDTVFPEGTDVKVKEQNGRLLAPGIGDDTRGIAVLISWIK